MMRTCKDGHREIVFLGWNELSNRANMCPACELLGKIETLREEIAELQFHIPANPDEEHQQEQERREASRQENMIDHIDWVA